MTELSSPAVPQAGAEVKVSAGLCSLQRLQGRALPHHFGLLEALCIPLSPSPSGLLFRVFASFLFLMRIYIIRFRD